MRMSVPRLRVAGIALILVAQGTIATGDSPGAPHQTAPDVLSRVSAPIGLPCAGLAVRLRPFFPLGDLTRKLLFSLDVVNVSSDRITVRPGIAGGYFAVLVISDGAGRVLYPTDLYAYVRGWEGSLGPAPPRELGPGEMMEFWRGLDVASRCRELDLAPGSYLAQALCVGRPKTGRSAWPKALLSNIVSFEWKGPAK